MGTSICNKIITRGFGPTRNGRASPVVQGYGRCPPAFVVETLAKQQRRIVTGRRPNDPALETVILWAKLIEANGKAPKNPIQGAIEIPIKKSQVGVFVEHVVHRIINKIKVTAKRIKGDT